MTNYNALTEMYIDTPYICGILENLEDDGYDADQAEEIINDELFAIYENCENMSDVAYEIAKNYGWLDYPSADYLDFDKFGNDLGIEGTFYQLDPSTFVEILI